MRSVVYRGRRLLAAVLVIALMTTGVAAAGIASTGEALIAAEPQPTTSSPGEWTLTEMLFVIWLMSTMSVPGG